MLVKDPGKTPMEILNEKYEYTFLNNNKEILEKEFECKIDILKAESSSEQKARQALPGRPAILVR